MVRKGIKLLYNSFVKFNLQSTDCKPALCKAEERSDIYCIATGMDVTFDD